MNNQEITVDLITENEKELLVFNFDEKLSLDLTSDNAEDLKKFFQDLLKKIENQNIDIKFNETDRTDLFYDVAKKYVEHFLSSNKSTVLSRANRTNKADLLPKKRHRNKQTRHIQKSYQKNDILEKSITQPSFRLIIFPSLFG